MDKIDTQWGILWTSPEDIAGTVTYVWNEDQARKYIGISFGCTGVLVSRTVTYSDWE